MTYSQISEFKTLYRYRQANSTKKMGYETLELLPFIIDTHNKLFGEKFIVKNFHQELCELLTRAAKRELEHYILIINMPPRYSKTQLMAYYVMWCFLRNNMARFIYSTYSHRLSMKISREIKKGFRLYGHKSSLSRDSAELWETHAGGGFWATTMGGSVTGFGAGDLYASPFSGDLIIDDPQKPSDAYFSTYRSSLIENFSNTFWSRRNNQDKIPIIVVQQRVHTDDLSGWLMNYSGYPFHQYKVQALDADGNATFPERVSRETLLELRKAAPHTFAAQQQQEPKSYAGNFFKREWFEVIDVLPHGWTHSVRYWDRACLIAGTEIITSTGVKLIENIRIGDKVLTRKGFSFVSDCGITKKTDEIVSVIFSNGSVVTGTKDHPIWTENRQWVNLSNLTEEDIVCTVKKDIFTTTNGIKKKRNIYTEHYTEMCMNFITESYPIAIISTTRMETNSTTQLKILKLSQENNTLKFTNTISYFKLISKILNIEKKHSELFKKEQNNQKNINVNIARPNFTQKVLKQNTAQLNASLIDVPVYDLTVTDQPEFFANGVLVHNSTKPNPANRDPDWTRGLRLLKYPNGLFVVFDLKSIRDTPLKVKNLIVNTATQDSFKTTVLGEQEPGSAGVSDALDFTKYLSGFVVRLRKPTKDKETRARAVAAQCEAGNIKVYRALWNEDFFEELENFPTGSHDDIVDTLSGAFNELAENRSILDVL